MRYGSMINQIADRAGTREVNVGDGATVLYWSDREPATVVEVVRYKTGERKGEVSGVWVTYDRATRVDKNGMSDAQTYEYETVPDGQRVLYTRRKNGKFVKAGGDQTLVVGRREKYHDFSF